MAYGVRIGTVALVRLVASRRPIKVECQDGPAAPCACVLDGIAIAVSARLGQRTLAPAEARDEAVVRQPAEALFRVRETVR